MVPVIVKGLEQPVFLTHAGDKSGRLFVLEQAGRIRIIQNGKLQPTPLLDWSSHIRSGGERGLLGLAFHPNFSKNQRLFINYTRAGDGATVVAKIQLSATSPPKETILMVIPQPYSNHNGGMIAFGPDGFLYIGTGDGGSGGDPENRGQNPLTLLGKILRIDIDKGNPYSIPPNNPVLSNQSPPEIFALGFRNPWRFSFDKMTGELWVGDVGQSHWEEIDRVVLGKNYGWRIMEGTHCFRPQSQCSRQGLILPEGEYPHTGSRCSITGGYVYRGKTIPMLLGHYIFGDYCSGEILQLTKGQITVLHSTAQQISSFGEDEEGELYVVGHGGTVHKLVGNSIP
jgi:glucose/arabinose dehydrogenase